MLGRAETAKREHWHPKHAKHNVSCKLINGWNYQQARNSKKIFAAACMSNSAFGFSFRRSHSIFDRFLEQTLYILSEDLELFGSEDFKRLLAET